MEEYRLESMKWNSFFLAGKCAHRDELTKGRKS